LDLSAATVGAGPAYVESEATVSTTPLSLR